jgi:hypothetical protein
MVAYNFQGRFAEAIEQGEKRQTVRAIGKRHHASPGDDLQLYIGMRTKSCRKVREAKCNDVCQITIYEDKILTFNPQEIHLGDDLEHFARRDGFASWSEMRDWFAKIHGLPFTGVLIRWLIPKTTGETPVPPEGA